MKQIKNVLIGLLLIAAVSVKASTVALTVASGVMTNIIPNFGSAKITQIIAATTGTNTATINLYDTFTNTTVYTNVAYSNILSYGTNYVSTWTNYYGVTNSVTNISLYDVTNSVAATTNSWPLRIAGAIPSNSVVRFDNVNYYFVNSAWVTNSGSGSVTLTVTFQQ